MIETTKTTSRRTRRAPTRLLDFGTGLAMPRWPGEPCEVDAALVSGGDAFIVYGERKSGIGTLCEHFKQRASNKDLMVLSVEQRDGFQLKVSAHGVAPPDPPSRVVAALQGALVASTDVAVEDAFAAMVEVLREKSHQCILVVNSIEQVTPARALFWLGAMVLPVLLGSRPPSVDARALPR